jgi:hypothetical protein
MTTLPKSVTAETGVVKITLNEDAEICVTVASAVG